MSTTLDKDIALQYSGANCKRGTIFEVRIVCREGEKPTIVSYGAKSLSLRGCVAL
jgi:hypothetical protein